MFKSLIFNLKLKSFFALMVRGPHRSTHVLQRPLDSLHDLYVHHDLVPLAQAQKLLPERVEFRLYSELPLDTQHFALVTWWPTGREVGFMLW